jgi:hypothetical protein
MVLAWARPKISSFPSKNFIFHATAEDLSDFRFTGCTGLEEEPTFASQTIDGGHKLGWIDTDAKAQNAEADISRAARDLTRVGRRHSH